MGGKHNVDLQFTPLRLFFLPHKLADFNLCTAVGHNIHIPLSSINNVNFVTKHSWRWGEKGGVGQTVCCEKYRSGPRSGHKETLSREIFSLIFQYLF
jgi:hypothetical protein